MSKKPILKSVPSLPKLDFLKAFTKKEAKLFRKELKLLLKKARKNIKKPNIKKIKEAFIFAEEKHSKQKRESGEKYFVHLYETANILLEYNVSNEIIIAGLLHDVLEDTDATEKEVEEKFGKTVLELVKGVTKLDIISLEGRKTAELKSFQKLLLASVKDYRVILIKLADKLHNSRTLSYLKPKKRKRIANQILQVYAPLAHRFGLHSIAREMEDSSFKILEPKIFQELSEKIKKQKKSKLKQTDSMIQILKNKIVFPFRNYRFYTLEKSLYNIYAKMKKGNRSLDEIYDYLVLVVVTKNFTECYEVLGLIHSTFYPIPGKLKDFIAVPRDGTYSSIHTTVLGPKGLPVRVYIRSERMDKIARKGIAALDPEKGSKTLYQKKLGRAAAVLELKLASSDKFFDALKEEFLQNHIFVFDNSGKIDSLPSHSTALDYAYHIDKNTGNNLKKVFVNGKEVPFFTELHSGNRIECVKSKKKTVSTDWLQMTNSLQTKEKIIKALKLSTRKSDKKIGLKYIFVRAGDRIGLMHDLTGVLSKFKINIENVYQERLGQNLYVEFRVDAKTKTKFDKAMKALKKVKKVTNVEEGLSK